MAWQPRPPVAPVYVPFIQHNPAAVYPTTGGALSRGAPSLPIANPTSPLAPMRAPPSLGTVNSFASPLSSASPGSIFPNLGSTGWTPPPGTPADLPAAVGALQAGTGAAPALLDMTILPGAGQESAGGPGGGAGVGDQAAAESNAAEAAETGETAGDASEGGPGGEAGGSDGWKNGGKVELHHGRAPVPGTNLMHDLQAMKAVLHHMMGRLRTLPGIDVSAFEQGVRTMEAGLAAIGASLRQMPR